MPEITKQPTTATRFTTGTTTSETNGEAKDYLKAFRTHGLTDLTLITGSSKPQARCECPFCGKSKMYISPETSKLDCKTCMPNGGNLTTFLRMVYNVSKEVGDDRFFEELRKDRKLLKISTLKAWGIRKHFLTGEVIVPGYNPQGKIVTLYRYVTEHKSGKRALYVTPATGHGLLAPSNTKGFADGPRLAEISNVFICEGVWDGMVLWEMMRYTKNPDTESALESSTRFSPTSSEEASLLKDTAVFAVPGCNVFYPQWPLVCAGKQVSLLFDNDHAKEAPPGSGRWVRTGYDGMKRVANILLNYEEPPESIQYLKWSGKIVTPGADKNPKQPSLSMDGYDPKLPDGADVRDFISLNGNPNKPADEKSRRNQLRQLLDKLTPIPDKWLAGRTSQVGKTLKGTKAQGSAQIEPMECKEWKPLVGQWQKAMRWTEGLDRALSVMLASVISTKSVGDQLWVQILSPPSTGKSVLCEALSVSKQHVLAKSTLRGFHSGFDTTGRGEEDNSLLAKLYDKTLVTKDGDTLLQAPNRSQILAEARDIYDRVSRTSYRTKMSRDYTGVNMTWILCGTGSLRLLDTSELGGR